MANNYYQKHKERLRKEARARNQKSFSRRKRQKAKKSPRKTSKFH